MPILLGTAGKETDKAILFSAHSVKPNINMPAFEWKSSGWWPLSHVTKIVRNEKGDDELYVSEWIAEKKGVYEELD